MTDNDRIESDQHSTGVTSPSNAATDRVTTMHYYAEAGIPSYLLVEPRPTLRAKLFRLVDGHYPVVGEGSAEQMLRMTEPFEVEIDVAALER